MEEPATVSKLQRVGPDCLLEFMCIKEIGWIHPLMPLGCFSPFSVLLVCLLVPLKGKDPGSESLTILSFPRVESHYHLVHIFIKMSDLLTLQTESFTSKTIL